MRGVSPLPCHRPLHAQPSCCCCAACKSDQRGGGGEEGGVPQVPGASRCYPGLISPPSLFNENPNPTRPTGTSSASIAGSSCKITEFPLWPQSSLPLPCLSIDPAPLQPSAPPALHLQCSHVVRLNRWQQLPTGRGVVLATLPQLLQFSCTPPDRSWDREGDWQTVTYTCPDVMYLGAS